MYSDDESESIYLNVQELTAFLWFGFLELTFFQTKNAAFKKALRMEHDWNFRGVEIFLS